LITDKEFRFFKLPIVHRLAVALEDVGVGAGMASFLLR